MIISKDLASLFFQMKTIYGISMRSVEPLSRLGINNDYGIPQFVFEYNRNSIDQYILLT